MVKIFDHPISVALTTKRTTGTFKDEEYFTEENEGCMAFDVSTEEIKTKL
jgi:hypothetical protein